MGAEAMGAEARLKELGIVLPDLPKPVANYLPYRLTGNILYLAGQGPRDANGVQLTGKLGAGVSVEEGYRRARLVGLGLLAATRDALGSLDRVDFIVKLLGMVNATPDFNDSPKVINGCSDLFVEVFGDAGRHARSAVGHVMLPNQISVEIEGIVAVKA
jgi:enamine deaminase RidA (YjgF/YER057c/UK114 family)